MRPHILTAMSAQLPVNEEFTRSCAPPFLVCRVRYTTPAALFFAAFRPSAPPHISCRPAPQGGNPMFLLQLLTQIEEAQPHSSSHRSRNSPLNDQLMIDTLQSLPASIKDSVLNSLSTASVELQSLLKAAGELRAH